MDGLFCFFFCIVPNRNPQALPQALPKHPQRGEGGRGIPTHKTTHYRGGEGGRGIPTHHKQGRIPINPTTHTTEGGAASQTIWGGGGRRTRDQTCMYNL